MIKLSQIVDALEDVDMSSSCYFNKKTNEILWSWDFNKENSSYNEEDKFNDDIISMFDYFSKNDYDIMQDFIDNVSNNELRFKLQNATSGRGAFSRFRCITDSNNITNDWYLFRDNKYKEIAKTWCTENNIEFLDDLNKK
jgi:hypothetical protein